MNGGRALDQDAGGGGSAGPGVSFVSQLADPLKGGGPGDAPGTWANANIIVGRIDLRPGGEFTSLTPWVNAWNEARPSPSGHFAHYGEAALDAARVVGTEWLLRPVWLSVSDPTGLPIEGVEVAVVDVDFEVDLFGGPTNVYGSFFPDIPLGDGAYRIEVRDPAAVGALVTFSHGDGVRRCTVRLPLDGVDPPSVDVPTECVQAP